MVEQMGEREPVVIDQLVEHPYLGAALQQPGHHHRADVSSPAHHQHGPRRKIHLKRHSPSSSVAERTSPASQPLVHEDCFDRVWRWSLLPERMRSLVTFHVSGSPSQDCDGHPGTTRLTDPRHTSPGVWSATS